MDLFINQKYVAFFVLCFIFVNIVTKSIWWESLLWHCSSWSTFADYIHCVCVCGFLQIPDTDIYYPPPFFYCSFFFLPKTFICAIEPYRFPAASIYLLFHHKCQFQFVLSANKFLRLFLPLQVFFFLSLKSYDAWFTHEPCSRKSF